MVESTATPAGRLKEAAVNAAPFEAPALVDLPAKVETEEVVVIVRTKLLEPSATEGRGSDQANELAE